MAYTWVGIGATSNGTGNSFNVAHPAGVLAGDVLLFAAAAKYSAFDHPGYMGLGNYVGGAGAAGIDSGDAVLTLAYKIADGSESGTTILATKSVPGETGQVSVLKIAAWRPTRTPDAMYNQGGVYAHTNGANWSVVQGLNHAAGLRVTDKIISISAVNGGGTSFTTSSMSLAGFVFSVPNFRTQNRTASGHGVHLVIAETDVLGGGGSSLGLTFNMSHASNLTNYPAGVTRNLILREVGAFRKRAFIID